MNRKEVGILAKFFTFFSDTHGNKRGIHKSDAVNVRTNSCIDLNWNCDWTVLCTFKNIESKNIRINF